MRLSRSLVLGAASLALVLAAADAQCSDCHLQASGQWGPIETYTGTDTCGGALSPDDRFLIEGDIEVIADLLQDESAGAGIEVLSGGSLRIGVGGGPRRISLGANGLSCAPGSVCEIQGGFRAPRDDSGDQAGDVLSDFPDASFWFFGQPIPCPGWDDSEGIWQPDCGAVLQDPGDFAGSNEVLGGHYAGPSDPERTAALDATKPGEVWYFGDGDPGDLEAGPETGFHYDIVDVRGTSAPGEPAGDFIHLDVLQGPADNGYSLQRRRILSCEIAEPVAARAREVFTGDDCLSADFERDGQWLRFEENGVAFADCPGMAAAPCEAESRVWRIQASENDVPCPSGGTCDRFTVADVRGLQEGRPAGGVVWISTVGAGEGDSSVVMVPVRIGSATPAISGESEHDSETHFEGETILRGVVFDRTGGFVFESTGENPIEDLFLRSPTHAGQVPFRFLVPGTDLTLRRITLIGGEEHELLGTGGGGNDHGLSLRSFDGQLDVILEDFSARYTWDDFIVTSGGLPPASLTIRRGRTQFEGQTVQSQSGVNTQNGVTEVWIEDFECIDCADNERPIYLIGEPTGSVRRVLFLAPKSDLGISVRGPIEDVTAIGARDSTSVALVSGRLDRCVIRENRHTGTAIMISGAAIDVNQCILRDNTVSLDLISAGFGEADLLIRNTVILDNIDADGSGDDVIDCRRISGSTSSCVVERTTIAYSTGRQGNPNNYRTGIRLTGAADGREVRLSESVLFGLQLGASVSVPTETTLQRVCFDENVTDAGQSALAALIDPLFGMLGLRDPVAGAFDPLPGGDADGHPCGIRGIPDSPGVCQRLWVHAVSGLEPECMAPKCSNGADDDFDGLRDYPEDPSCSSAESDDESEPACSDGMDNDGDGLTDYPNDPACQDVFSSSEESRCQDGINNDLALGTDFDGGESILGIGNGDPNGADPNCIGTPWRNTEGDGRSCGLGIELAVLLPGLMWLCRRRQLPTA